MPTYEVFMKVRLLEVAPKSDSQRRAIMNFISSLGARPHTFGDYVEFDAIGRECQVKLIGDYAVTYWSDHAVKVVMVINVQRADRGHSP